MTESTRDTLAIIVDPVDTAPSVPAAPSISHKLRNIPEVSNALWHWLKYAHFPLVLNLLWIQFIRFLPLGFDDKFAADEFPSLIGSFGVLFPEKL